MAGETGVDGTPREGRRGCVLICCCLSHLIIDHESPWRRSAKGRGGREQSGGGEGRKGRGEKGRRGGRGTGGDGNWMRLNAGRAVGGPYGERLRGAGLVELTACRGVGGFGGEQVL